MKLDVALKGTCGTSASCCELIVGGAVTGHQGLSIKSHPIMKNLH